MTAVLSWRLVSAVLGVESGPLSVGLSACPGDIVLGSKLFDTSDGRSRRLEWCLLGSRGCAGD
jgi:hypothetical protein